jgi:SAM-dependent methyltransferase
MTHVPFDRTACDYDRQFTDTAIGKMQRACVYRLSGLAVAEPATAESAGAVLEINCGTGADAVWLAGLGYRVLATDRSPKMVEIAQKKLTEAHFGATSRATICDINRLSALTADDFTKFDLIWSNFGGLNCLSDKDLSRLNDTLPNLLSKKGRFIAVIMGRFCWWESLYFCLKGNLRQAFRRFKKDGITAPTGEPGDFVTTWYYTPRALRQLFPNFTVNNLQPIGFWVPPSYLEPFFRRFPRFLRALNVLERWATARWMAWGSDHFLIEFT